MASDKEKLSVGYCKSCTDGHVLLDGVCRECRQPERIKYTPQLVIKNTQFLAPGLGLRYLECIRAHNGELVAKMWHREEPKSAKIVVYF